MAWEKSSDRLIEAFDAALPDDARIERRKMFGYPSAFVNGNLFTGLHQHDLIVRLDEDARAELMNIPGAGRFEPMAGRVMREYVSVPRTMQDDADTLSAWIARSLGFALTLPVKEKKSRARKKKA